MAQLKTMAEIWAQMQKQHGEEGLFSGDQSMFNDTGDAISTGSYLLDDALGIWGIPRGSVLQIAGFESSGKSLLALMLVREWQKKDPKNWAFWVDAELAFDQTWAKALGVDLERLLVYRENDAIKIFERLIGQPNKSDASKPKIKKGLLDLEIESGGTGLGLVVIDSVAFIIPPAEETSAVGKANMALLARFLPPELRKITPLLNKSKVSLIGINQLRMKPGVMYGNPEESPGGSAFKYACAQMIHLAKMNGKDAQILSNSGEQIGHKIRIRIDKNKKAPPNRTAEVAIKYLEGITDLNVELAILGLKYGVVKKLNNISYEYDGKEFRGKDSLYEYFKDNSLHVSLLEKIKKSKEIMIQNNTTGEIIEEEKSEVEE